MGYRKLYHNLRIEHIKGVGSEGDYFIVDGSDIIRSGIRGIPDLLEAKTILANLETIKTFVFVG